MSKNRYSNNSKKCPNCNGEKFILDKDKETNEFIWKTCPRCKGKGVI